MASADRITRAGIPPPTAVVIAEEINGTVGTTTKVEAADSGNFFSGDNANIQRLGDRAFLGTAVNQDGAAIPAQRTWAGLEANGYLTYLDTRSTFECISTIGGVCHAAATRVSDTPAGMTNVTISYAALAKNDVVSETPSDRRAVWPFYALAVREPDAGAAIAGATQVGETHIVNRGGTVDVNPYASAGMTSGVTYNWIFGAGGEYSESGISCNPVSACINIASGNGATFRKGIKFTANALDGCDGTTGVADALALAKGHQLTWFYSGSDAARGMTIRSDCGDINFAAKIVNTNSGLRFYDQWEKTVFRLYPASLTSGQGSNNLIIKQAPQGVDPSLAAEGSGTNVNCVVQGKGTGGLVVKDGSGNTVFQANASRPTLPAELPVDGSATNEQLAEAYNAIRSLLVNSKQSL